MNDFGNFLYALRKEKGMTQAELAASLGVTNKAVSKWETGEAMPETSQLLPISRIFGVTVDELLEGKRRDGGENAQTEDRLSDEELSKEFMRRYMFKHGKDEIQTLPGKICGIICASLILLSLTAYLIVGGLTNVWHPYWIIIPDCALICGILGVVFDLCDRKKRGLKIEKGENPYTGAACGIIMIAGILTFLNLGVFIGIWHPAWIIPVICAVICAFVGALGNIFFKKHD